MVIVLFLVARENENIINIDNAYHIQQVAEDVLDEPLENAGGVREAEGHDRVFEESEVRTERSLPLVALTDAYEVERTLEVDDGEDVAALDAVENVVDERKGIRVLLGDCVEAAVVDAQPQLASLLLDE